MYVCVWGGYVIIKDMDNPGGCQDKWRKLDTEWQIHTVCWEEIGSLSNELGAKRKRGRNKRRENVGFPCEREGNEGKTMLGEIFPIHPSGAAYKRGRWALPSSKEDRGAWSPT